MHRIQAIICFNGGAAGDLLKALCLLAWDLDMSMLHDSGRIDFNNQYFKLACQEIYLKNSVVDDLDWSQVFPIENSHFYLPCYTDMAKKLYYIDYDDSINSIILNEYVRKRHESNWSYFLDYHVNFVPLNLQKHINLDNCQQVFEINWKKNLKSWRSNDNLNPIDFGDLLDRNKILNLVETITDKKFNDTTLFDKIYLSWQANNSRLLKLVT